VAGKLRVASTPDERTLWALLRDRRLVGVKFRRQHQFGPYVLDFFCPEARVAVELDGGQHFESAAVERDAERDAYLASRGVRVLRFTNREVRFERDAVLAAILSALGTPSP